MASHNVGMLRASAWPAEVGILAGFVTFVALLAPILLWESRRVGRIRFSRAVGAAMVCVYGAALLAYTLLPLPSVQWCSAHPTPQRNLVPLHFVRPILGIYRDHGAGALLTSFVSLQAAMNVVLFIPWGALWRRFFGSGLVFATLSGFAMSVIIESAQTTGFFGLFPCGNRTGDIDDVITNTLGSLLGALLAPLLFFLPEPRAVLRKRPHPRPVTRVRRLLAMAADVLAVTATYVMVMISFRAQQVFGFRESNSPALLAWESFWAWFVAVGLFVVLPPLLRSGATFGQRAMWLEVEYPSGGKGRMIAWVCGLGGWAVLRALAHLPGIGEAGPVLEVVALGGAVVSILGVMLDPLAAGLSIRLAGGRVADSRGAGQEATSST